MDMKALTKRKFGTLPVDQAFHDELTRAGFESGALKDLISMGLPWWQIITLGFQFWSEYGTELVAVVTDIINLFKTSGTDPAALLAGLDELVTKYGGPLYEMATLIASWLGVTLPPQVTAASAKAASAKAEAKASRVAAATKAHDKQDAADARAQDKADKAEAKKK
jgi:hypothetical protein